MAKAVKICLIFVYIFMDLNLELAQFGTPHLKAQTLCPSQYVKTINILGKKLCNTDTCYFYSFHSESQLAFHQGGNKTSTDSDQDRV